MPTELLVTLSGATRDLAVAGTVGSLLMILAVLPRGHRAVRRAVAMAQVSAVVWTLSALVFSLASYANIRGVGVEPNRFVEEWWSFLTTIPLGNAYLWMLVSAAVVSMVVGLVDKPAHAAWALVPVVWAVGWQGQTGHAAGAADHHLAVVAMGVHIAGMSIWVGVLGALVVLKSALGAQPGPLVRRSVSIVAWGALAVVASGAASAVVRLSGPGDLFTSAYGRLLAVKVLLMGAVLLAAMWHRLRLLPSLEADGSSRKFWTIVGVDVAALAAVVTIAVVMSRMAPPVPPVPLAEPTPAFRLTGYPLPPPQSFETWFTLWRLEFLSAFVLVMMTVTYLRWVRRLRRRADSWPWHRTAWFVAAMALLAWLTQSGPSIYGRVLFSAHMLEHMFLVMVAPVALVMSAPVTLALRALPVRTDHSRGPREWLRVMVDSRVLRFLAHPVVAAVNFAGSMVIFYFTPVFEFALSNHLGHLWMLIHFTAAGYFFVNALVGIDPGPTRPGYPLRILLLFATMAFHAFFGVTLMASEVLLAPRWFGLMGRDWGPDALTDQQFGGQIAWGIGELPVLFLAIGVFLSWRRADTREARRSDRKADRDGDAELRRYNEMLARLQQERPEESANRQ